MKAQRPTNTIHTHQCRKGTYYTLLDLARDQSIQNGRPIVSIYCGVDGSLISITEFFFPPEIRRKHLFTTGERKEAFNPFRTAVPLWGQTTRNLTSLFPKRNCCTKRIKRAKRTNNRRLQHWFSATCIKTGLQSWENVEA